MRQTLINGRWPIKLPEHRADFHEARPWWEAARLADMVAWVRENRHGKPKMLDVGSEEGDLTALYASWYCDVAYIDPSKPWVAQTIETLVKNGFGVGPSFVGFAAEVDMLEGQMITEPRFGVLTEEPDIARITLDSFVGLTGFKPDAVTMDVEGSELTVLRGAVDLLNTDITWWIAIHGEVDINAATPSPVHVVMRNYGYNDQFLAFDHEFHYRFYRELS